MDIGASEILKRAMEFGKQTKESIAVYSPENSAIIAVMVKAREGDERLKEF